MTVAQCHPQKHIKTHLTKSPRFFGVVATTVGPHVGDDDDDVDVSLR